VIYEDLKLSFSIRIFYLNRSYWVFEGIFVETHLLTRFGTLLGIRFGMFVETQTLAGFQWNACGKTCIDEVFLILIFY